MSEDAYIKSLTTELQHLRSELHDMRELLTEVRVAMAGIARQQDLAVLEKRVTKLEHDTNDLKSDGLSRRDFHRWIIPIVISLLSTMAVLGIKVWDVLQP